MSVFIDLTGLIFNRLTVMSLDLTHIAKNGGRKWLCKCECGNIISARSDGLRSGHSKSCGCLNREISSNRIQFDLSGKVFGQLTVLNRAEYKTPSGGAVWLCKCSCGNIKTVSAGSLNSGVKSCGCYKLQINKQQSANINRHYRLVNGLDPDKSMSSEIELCRSRFKKIRKIILVRDNNKCILCQNMKSLHVHHIVPLSHNLDVGLNMNNLITLCEGCHFNFAHINGNTQKLNLIFQKLFVSYLTLNGNSDHATETLLENNLSSETLLQ